MNIAQSTALFSLLGTTYGGNGQTTFGLPDLQGRVAVSAGQGPGLSSISLGQSYGTETVALTAAQLPAHTHSLFGVSGPGNRNAAPGNTLARSVGTTSYSDSTTGLTAMAGTALGPTGQSAAHNNMQPVLAATYCIALQGIYPQRP